MRQDFTLAIGSVARNPVFAVVSIFTIALGIGLNTSVFGIVNVLLFRPPSLDAAHELIWVLSASTKANGPRGNMTYPDVEDLRTLPVLAGVVTYGETPANVATTENAARLTGQLVTPDFFTLRALAAQVRALDATVAVFDPMTLGDHIANRLDGERALSRLLTLIGILALVLAQSACMAWSPTQWSAAHVKSACVSRSAPSRTRSYDSSSGMPRVWL